MSTIAIKAENLSKYYKLGVINNGTLFRDIQTWWDLKRGRPDRHSRIGSSKYNQTTNGFWALKDLNFEIHQGDRVGIIGKNGAGKSTLLKILSRITAPTQGNVKIKGRVASLLEVGTGFHGELTGRENIYLNGAILGMKKKEVDHKIDEIIAFSEIEQHIDTPVKRYSSGMYVRLAFAVAAHLDSEILIADEVLAVGDASFQKKALGKMNDLSTGEGRTVLFVSHNMAAVQTLCNNGFLLNKGKILYSGEIDKCIYNYLNSTQESCPLKYMKNRIGNQNFKFTSMTFLDKYDRNCDSVISGDFLRIKFEYEKKDFINMDNMIFSISLSDDYQKYIATFITDEMQTKNENLNNYFYLDIDELNLGGGTYNIRLFSSYLNTGIDDVCDCIDIAGTLTVLAGDFWRTGQNNRPRQEAMLKAHYII